MKHEFMLKINDGDGWAEKFERYHELLCPATVPFERISGWGSARILVEGAEVSFSDEDFGFAVVFESGDLPHERAVEILRDICRNIEALSDSTTTIVSVS